MLALTAAGFTAEDTTKILVNRYIPLWRCSSSPMPDNGPKVCVQLAAAVFKLLGVYKLITNASCHHSGNGGVECVNHTIVHMIYNEYQNN